MRVTGRPYISMGSYQINKNKIMRFKPGLYCISLFFVGSIDLMPDTFEIVNLNFVDSISCHVHALINESVGPRGYVVNALCTFLGKA